MRNCSSRRLRAPYHFYHRVFFFWQLIYRTVVPALARVSKLLCEHVSRFTSVGCELFESRSHRVPCRNIASRKTQRVEPQLGPLFLGVDNTRSSWWKLGEHRPRNPLLSRTPSQLNSSLWFPSPRDVVRTPGSQGSREAQNKINKDINSRIILNDTTITLSLLNYNNIFKQ